MSNDLSKPAFISWALLPPFIAWMLVQSDKNGYLFLFGGMIASVVVLLGALIIGWTTKTIGSSLLGTLAGFMLVAVGINAL